MSAFTRSSMKILVDTLTITWQYDMYTDLCEAFSMISIGAVPMKTRYYESGLYVSGLLIAYNSCDGHIIETYLNLSGTGCRFVETICKEWNWFQFLNRFDEDYRLHRAHIARLDIACDMVDNEVPFDVLYKYTFAGHYICKSKLLPDVRSVRTQQIYFGSPKSDRLLRIYDKAMEQGIEGCYWVRMEFQLRNDCAMSFYLNWCKYHDIGVCYYGVLVDFLRFVDVPAGHTIEDYKQNKHYDRLPTARWWQAIVANAQAISQLYLPGDSYTMDKLERYVFRQTVSSYRTYLICHGGDTTEIFKRIEHAKLSIRQRELIAQYLAPILKEELEENKSEKN